MNRDKFIDNLTAARKSRGLTQKQVAEALGVSDRTYSKWETGDTEPSLEHICSLAEFYGISPAEFFREEAPKEGILRNELKTMTPVQAMLRTREIMDEAYDGLCDNAWYWSDRLDEDYEEALRFSRELLPVMPPPADSPSTPLFIHRPNGFYLRHWDKNMDLRLLLMPNEAGDAWMKAESSELRALFRALSSWELIRLLLESPPAPPERWYSPEYLSGETGLPLNEVREALQTLRELGIVYHSPTLTADGTLETCQLTDNGVLRGIAALAHLALGNRRREAAE